MLIPLKPQTREPVRPRRDLGGLPRSLVAVFVTLACAMFLLEFGLGLPPWLLGWLRWVDLALAAGFAVDLLLVWQRAPSKGTLLRQRWYEYVVLVLWIVGLLVLCLGGLVFQRVLVPLLTEFQTQSVTDTWG